MGTFGTAWWFTATIVAAAWSAHQVAVGISWATLVPLLVLCLASKSVVGWLYTKPGFSILLGTVTGLAMIFAIELYFGITVVKLGPLDPRIRQPNALEEGILKGLAIIYSPDLKKYYEVVGTGLVAVVGFLGELWFRRNDPVPEATGEPGKSAPDYPRNRIGTYAGRVFQFGGAFLFVIQTITFANAINVAGPGYNVYAAIYKTDLYRIGSNANREDILNEEIRNLDLFERLLTDNPDGELIKSLIRNSGRLAYNLSFLDSRTRNNSGPNRSGATDWTDNLFPRVDYGGPRSTGAFKVYAHKLDKVLGIQSGSTLQEERLIARREEFSEKLTRVSALLMIKTFTRAEPLPGQAPQAINKIVSTVASYGIPRAVAHTMEVTQKLDAIIQEEKMRTLERDMRL